MTGAKGLIADLLLWCLLAVLLAAGFVNAAEVLKYPDISLRYDTPIKGQAAYAARRYAIAHSEEEPFWPTYWREGKLELSGEHVTASVDCIAFSGDAALVWPAQYLWGSAPGVTDSAGLAVSSALAQRLWGGVDVAGKTVEADGQALRILGVFAHDHELALLSFQDEDTSQSWYAVELSGGPTQAARSDAESFATACGLGRPDAILMGTGPAFLSGLMAALPLLVLATYALALTLSRLKGVSGIVRGLLLFCLVMGFAFVLPYLLEALPSWTIPTQWSDFAFWAELFEQMGGELRELLAAPPGIRDVQSRLSLLKQAGIAFLSTCCALCVCFRWSRRTTVARRQASA